MTQEGTRDMGMLDIHVRSSGCFSNSFLITLHFPSPSLVLNLTAKRLSVPSSKSRTHNPSLSRYKFRDLNIPPAIAAVAQWLERLSNK
jgi:hypothetical protein